MNIPFLIIIGSVLASLVLAVVIIINSNRSKSSLYFFIMVASITGWIVSNYLSNYVDNYNLAILYNKLIFVTTSIFAWAFVMFSMYFPGEKKVKVKYSLIPFLLCIVALVISFSQVLVKSITIKESISEIVFGWGIYYYVSFFIGCLVFSFYKFIVDYIKSKDKNIKKTIQVLFIVFGVYLLVSVITNLILPVILSNFDFTNLAPIYTILFIYAIAWIVLKFRFLNIKVIATELFASFLAAIIFVEIFQGANLFDFIFRTIVFIVTFIFAIFLIRSVLLEVKRREEMEKLNTELQKATSEIQIANKELQRLDDAKSEFLSIASHQLRTPVTIIKGYASMIIEGSYGKVSQKIVDVMKNVYLANDRLLNLIENLLDISRIEAGRLEFHLQTINLADVVKPIVTDFQQKAKAKGLKLEFYENERVPQAVADVKKISEVISNIIDNSVKYTPKGEITVSLHEEGSSVVFVCQDTGLGIIAEDLPRLFHKFVRGKDMMKVHTEGTGLGMYFARTVIENMGGRIWAESPGKNRGSKFCFSLPLADKKKAKKLKAE